MIDYRQLFEQCSVPIAVWFIHPTDEGASYLLQANQGCQDQLKEQWGIDAAAVVGSPARDSWPSLMGPEGLLRVYQEVLRNGQPHHFQYTWTADQMLPRTYQCEVFKVSEEHIALAYLDVTDALSRAKDVEWFGAAASHDLLNPIRESRTAFQKVKPYLGKDPKPWDARGERWLRFLHRGLSKLETVASDFVEYISAPEGGEDRLSLRDLTMFVQKQVSGIPVPTLAFEETFAWGHRAGLHTVLRNLFDNAVKYQHPHRELMVEVGSRVEDSLLVVWVRDNGMGVQEKHLGSIFDPSKRLHRYDDIPGSGLGLATCRRIMERHRSKLWMESDGQSGSTVFFTLRRGE